MCASRLYVCMYACVYIIISAELHVYTYNLCGRYLVCIIETTSGDNAQDLTGNIYIEYTILKTHIFIISTRSSFFSFKNHFIIMLLTVIYNNYFWSLILFRQKSTVHSWYYVCTLYLYTPLSTYTQHKVAAVTQTYHL